MNPPLFSQEHYLVIRADASKAIGVGHVLRCIALAHAWHESGRKVYFATHCDIDTLLTRIRQTGAEIITMSREGAEEEPEAFLSVLEGLRAEHAHEPSWVILDGYNFGQGYQRALRNEGCRVLVVDDYNHVPFYDADIILNQNIKSGDYHYLHDPGTIELLGLGYVLMRQDYLGLRDYERVIPYKAKNILITFGGADKRDATSLAIRALNGLADPELEIKVVIGPANVNQESVSSQLSHSPYAYELLKDVSDMSHLYTWADLALAGGGTTCWELALAGLPAVLIPLADNQEKNVQGLVEAGAAVSFGRLEALTSDSFPSSLRGLVFDKRAREDLSRNARSLVDGLGAKRVVSVMDAVTGRVSKEAFSFRAVSPSDMMQLYGLANDPTVRKNSFKSSLICLDDHKKWFEQKIGSPDETVMYVFDHKGLIIAQIRYDRNGEDCAEIDYSVHPAFRGRDIGKAIMEESRYIACRRLGVRFLRGRVKKDNHPSIGCFIRNGFRRRELNGVGESDYLIYEFDSMAGQEPSRQ